MGEMHRCVRVGNAIMTVGPESEFTDSEVESERRRLARAWGVALDTVADFEAIATLRNRRSAPKS